MTDKEQIAALNFKLKTVRKYVTSIKSKIFTDPKFQMEAVNRKCDFTLGYIDKELTIERVRTSTRTRRVPTTYRANTTR